MKKIFRDKPYLYKSNDDGLIRRCVPECEMLSVLKACYPHPLVDIIVVSELLIIYYNVVTIGQLFITMLMSLLKHVIDAKEMAEFQESKISL